MGVKPPQPSESFPAPTPARSVEPGCSGTNPWWESEWKGKGAEEWKPAPGEGNRQGEHPGPLDGFCLLAGLPVSFKGVG